MNTYERRPLANTGLPNGVHIWLNRAERGNRDEYTARVGRHYETAAAVKIDADILLSDGVQQLLDTQQLTTSDWDEIKKFIAEHVWLLKEGCIGYIDRWSVENALLLEEYFGESLSYDWYRVGDIGSVELFEVELSGMMKGCQIAGYGEMDYRVESPTKASGYTLPQWDESLLPEGDEEHGMVHIIKNHTRDGRLRTLLGKGSIGNNTGDIVTKRLNMTATTYDTLRTLILRKLQTKSATFDRKEAELIDFVITQVNKKDLFPAKMSERRIREVIRNAYENAGLEGLIQPATLRDRFNEYGGECLWDRDLYHGVADGFVIHIWFLVDDMEIATAYPVQR